VDVTILATVGFTALAALGILAVLVGSRKRK
jgi:hypothetical protein